MHYNELTCVGIKFGSSKAYLR